MAESHLLLRVESNGTTGTGGRRRLPPRMNSSDPRPAGHTADKLPGRDALRREMRKKRRLLPQADRDEAARSLARVASRHRILRPGARIAIYLAHGGEIDLAPLTAVARRHRCRLYLPVIASIGRPSMRFVRYDTSTKLRPNRFGILEPTSAGTSSIAARHFDAVLVPLVAVDARGWRLGSGAGYYDRYFKHLRLGRRWRKPRLIGICYDFQRVPVIEYAPWDVPLDAVITDRDCYPVRHSS